MMNHFETLKIQKEHEEREISYLNKKKETVTTKKIEDDIKRIMKKEGDQVWNP